MDQGGEIAFNLEQLYSHCLIRLMDVDRHNDVQAAEEVIGLLRPIRDSWYVLSEKSEGELRQAIMAVQQGQPAQPTGERKPAGDETPAPAKSTLSISA